MEAAIERAERTFRTSIGLLKTYTKRGESQLSLYIDWLLSILHVFLCLKNARCRNVQLLPRGTRWLFKKKNKQKPCDLTENRCDLDVLYFSADFFGLFPSSNLFFKSYYARFFSDIIRAYMGACVETLFRVPTMRPPLSWLSNHSNVNSPLVQVHHSLPLRILIVSSKFGFFDAEVSKGSSGCQERGHVKRSLGIFFFFFVVVRSLYILVPPSFSNERNLVHF